MTYFAAENLVSTGPIEGGIEITPDQYKAAIAGMVDGKAVSIDGGFSLVDPNPAPESEIDPEPLPLPQYAAVKRWEKEVGGTMLGEMLVATDERSRVLIMGARSEAERNPGFTTPWKTASGGFERIGSETIIAISNAVFEHIAKCFETEEAVSAGIAAGTITTVAEIDAAFA